MVGAFHSILSVCFICLSYLNCKARLHIKIFLSVLRTTLKLGPKRELGLHQLLGGAVDRVRFLLGANQGFDLLLEGLFG